MIENIEGISIKVKYLDEPIELPEEIRNKILEFWKLAKAKTPGIWNGEELCVSEYKKDGATIVITCKKSNYAHYIYDERVGLPRQYWCSSLIGACLLETSDGYYIVGELEENTSFPHCMQISGGGADFNDVKDGEIDFLNTIIRECKEELNINLQDKEQVEDFNMKYIRLPNENGHTYILLAKGKIRMTKDEMNKYYQDYLGYLRENDLEVEFSKIHFIKKGRSTEELKAFENPKREYLQSLLEIDS